MPDEQPSATLDRELTTNIVAAYVRRNQIGSDQLATLILTVHQALVGLGKPVDEGSGPRTPAVPIRRSVQHDYVVCLECGWRGLMVRRHLATGHGLSVDDYRARWNQREEDLFDRLSNHSPDHLAGDLVKDVDAAVGFINSRYCAEHEFSATAQKYQLIIKALSADGDSAAVRQARAEVQIDLLVTLISSGDYSLGLRPRGAMLARMCGRVRLSSDVSEIKLVFAVPPDRPTPNIAPSWNVAPTDPLPVDEQRQRHADRSAIVVTAWEIARQKGATIEERWEIYEREVGRLSREFEEKWGVPARV